MRRLKIVVLLSLAVILTAQPLLHHHSLQHSQQSDGTAAPPCSVCAFGADARVHAPAIAAPLEVAITFAPLVETAAPAEAVTATPARAPPAA